MDRDSIIATLEAAIEHLKADREDSAAWRIADSLAALAIWADVDLEGLGQYTGYGARIQIKEGSDAAKDILRVEKSASESRSANPPAPSSPLIYPAEWSRVPRADGFYWMDAAEFQPQVVEIATAEDGIRRVWLGGEPTAFDLPSMQSMEAEWVGPLAMPKLKPLGEWIPRDPQ